MSEVYRFGPFTLDPAQRTVTRDGMPVPITPKAFDILLFLLQHPNQVVTKQDLMKAVWPDTFVEEGNLTQNISLLRRALAEHGEDSGLIVTVARQGYRLSAQVGVTREVVTGDVAVVPERRADRGRALRWRTILGIAAVALLAIGGVSWVWQRSRAGAGESEAIRLAVLPFDNLTGDPGQDYLADGLTEELITQLGRLNPQQLGVIARTSVMGYKHNPKRMDEIGRELSVRYAIESSLRRSADRLRVTVQLIRTRDQSHVWAQDFDYAPQDILGMEDDVAGAVAHEVQLRLTPVERARLARSPSANAAAVDAVLRGREIMRLRLDSKENWAIAKRYFERATTLDPASPLAWAWLSSALRYGVDRGYVAAEEGIRGARQAVERALALDPDLPEGYEQLGQLQRLVEWNWAKASESYRRALELDPGNVDILLGSAFMAAALGRVDQEVALARRATELDPLDPRALDLLGVAYYDAGHLDDAAKQIERVSPALRDAISTETLAEVYLAQGRVADAATTVEQGSADPEWQLQGRSLVYFRQGRRRLADSALRDYIARYATDAAYQVAEIYAFRGETDQAFAWLERAYAQRDQGLSYTKADPMLANLRGDPRYTAFLAKMRLPL